MERKDFDEKGTEIMFYPLERKPPFLFEMVIQTLDDDVQNGYLGDMKTYKFIDLENSGLSFQLCRKLIENTVETINKPHKIPTILIRRRNCFSL